MGTGTEPINLVYELAQIIAAGGNYSVATALRHLARAGYTSMDEVEGASDWTLLSVSGIGTERLRAVRRLTRADWQPPSPQATRAAAHFRAAARFALRFWPQETLAACIEGSAAEVAGDRPHESRWAIELFSAAAGEALPHCRPEDLLGILDAEARKFGRSPAARIAFS